MGIIRGILKIFLKKSLTNNSICDIVLLETKSELKSELKNSKGVTI